MARPVLVPVPAAVIDTVLADAARSGATPDEIVAAALWAFSQLPAAVKKEALWTGCISPYPPLQPSS